MINQPQVKAIIGEFKLCEKMAQFDPKKFAEVQGKIKQSGGGEKVRLWVDEAVTVCGGEGLKVRLWSATVCGCDGLGELRLWAVTVGI